MTTALEGGKGSASCPCWSLPPGKNQYPLYRRMGGPQGLSGQVRKILPPPGFYPRTVQPIASRYTDYATWPTIQFTGNIKWSWIIAPKYHYFQQSQTEHSTVHWCITIFNNPRQSTAHYTDVFVSCWHSFYIHCSGRSNCLPHQQHFSSTPSTCLYHQVNNKKPQHSWGYTTESVNFLLSPRPPSPSPPPPQPQPPPPTTTKPKTTTLTILSILRILP